MPKAEGETAAMTPDPQRGASLPLGSHLRSPPYERPTATWETPDDRL